jgi:hypothetical protein
MGTGRTLRKHSHTRPVKTQGEKRRRSKVQRARLVKLGMDEAVVKKMQTEVVRVLVQKPVKVKKLVAAKAATPAEAAAAKPKKVVKAKAPKAEASAVAPKKAVKAKVPKAATKAE